MAYFRWQGRIDSQKQVEFPLEQLQFGGGYRLDVPVAPKLQLGTWPMVFDFERRTIVAIQHFLDTHAGGADFDFQDPELGTWHKVICKGYRVQSRGANAGRARLTATFEEVRRW